MKKLGVKKFIEFFNLKDLKYLKSNSNKINLIWYPDFGPWHIGHFFYLKSLNLLQKHFNIKIYFFIDFANEKNFHTKKNLTYFNFKKYYSFVLKFIQPENTINFQFYQEIQKFIRNSKKIKRLYDYHSSFYMLKFFYEYYNIENQNNFICVDEENVKILAKSDRSVIKYQLNNWIINKIINLPYSRRFLKKDLFEYHPEVQKNLFILKKLLKKV